ncbi:hypothetical protein [Tunicatimonas pelagia]|uniref:hypothetical protein n=1 Tax=Tunicatimonas pelagia TaxID=931531 RepID=UPI0026663BB8|nr:hypothetical protein [Tunicatimonas pelagia]WKN44904.1 hypothetical protein P0M28_08005 [Tunicatimonas pelagia]
MAKVKSIKAENGQATVAEATALVDTENYINFFEQGHEIPDKRNQYMKFESGKNRIRFVGNPISGFVFFGKIEREDGTETVKPYRRRESEGEFSLEEMINRDARTNKDGELEKQKYFVAGLVYNYQKERLQVLEITQKSILKALKSYVDSEEYGHPSGYDLTIEKKGDGLNTDYSVIASPPKSLSAEIETLVGETSCDLPKIYDGEYPLG